jgi:hypothetical protein
MRFTRILLFAMLATALAWGKADAAYCPPPSPVPAPLIPAYCPPTIPVPSLQSQAEFLGGEDYFQAHGGNSADFVKALYSDVLGRAPAESEIQRWTSELARCGDGVVLSREFLIYSQTELAARAAANPPPVVVQPIYQRTYVARPPRHARDHDYRHDRSHDRRR